MNVVILVTHLLGIGHLNRAAALGRAFARAGDRVTLISGGRPQPTVDMSGIDLRQLPPVHIQGTDFKTFFRDDGRVADAVFYNERIKILEEFLHNAQPDVLISELFPFGRRQLAAEFDAALVAARNNGRSCTVFGSVRDVLAPPSTPKKHDFAEERVAQHFQAVLVHGDASVLPLEASWPVSRGLVRCLRYTGYVRDAAPAPAATGQGGTGEVLVSGGGSAAALPLLRAALAAAARDPGRNWRLLVGHGVDAATFAELQNAATPKTTVERVRRDFNALLSACACSVSLAGYNTMLDLAAARVPAVVVPFDAGGEVEQGIRAGKFADMGLLSVVESRDLSDETLLRAVYQAIRRGPPKAMLAMDGATKTVEIVRSEREKAERTETAWRKLSAALDRAAAAGITIPVWWRDDDAVAPSEALDRLLALASRHHAPVPLAVIPEKAEATLADRLRQEPLAEVLVHGIAHCNNADSGAKKQELVADDAATSAALQAGLSCLNALFGPKALPVLVPPWNRIAPALVDRLGDIGFAGLSTFAAEPAEPPVRQVNTHVDPIDWKGGGGLACALAHIHHTTALIEAFLAGERDRPIGLLTHHLVHDPWLWQFVERWVCTMAGHKAVRFLPASACFGLTDAGARAPKGNGTWRGEAAPRGVRGRHE